MPSSLGASFYEQLALTAATLGCLLVTWEVYSRIYSLEHHLLHFSCDLVLQGSSSWTSSLMRPSHSQEHLCSAHSHRSHDWLGRCQQDNRTKRATMFSQWGPDQRNGLRDSHEQVQQGFLNFGSLASRNSSKWTGRFDLSSLAGADALRSTYHLTAVHQRHFCLKIPVASQYLARSLRDTED